MKKIISFILILISLGSNATLEKSIEECKIIYGTNINYSTLGKIDLDHLDTGVNIYSVKYRNYMIELIFHTKYENDVFIGNYCHEIRYYLGENGTLEVIHRLINKNLGESVDLDGAHKIAIKIPQKFDIIEDLDTGAPLFSMYNVNRYIDVNPVTKLKDLDEYNAITADTLMRAGIKIKSSGNDKDKKIKGFRYQIGDCDLKSNWIQCEFTADFKLLVIRDLERYMDILNVEIPFIIQNQIKNAFD